MNYKQKITVALSASLLLLGSNLCASPSQSELSNMKKIVGYFPDWGVYGGHRNFYVDKIQFDKVTHINVAFAKINDDLTLDTPDAWADLENPYGEAWDSPYKGNYGQLEKFKASHPNTSIMISIGGWTLSANFHEAALNETNRQLFAKNAVEYMKAHHFDGLDIDWEYPTSQREPDKVDNINDTGTPRADAAEKENFTLLLKALRDALDEQGSIDNKYYQLTAAIGASSALMQATELEKYPQYLDMINIMSYDMHGAWEDRTNHHSAIYPNPNLPSDGLTSQEAAQRLVDAGVSKSKIVIGSPFYSRGWKGVENNGGIKNVDGSLLPGLYGSATGGAAGRWDGGRAAGVNAYYDIVNEMIGNDGFKVYRDNYSKVPYLYSESKKEFYSYEDPISAQARVDFVNENSYGGIIIWELSADMRADLGETETQLLDVIFRGFYENGTIADLEFEDNAEIFVEENTTLAQEQEAIIDANNKENGAGGITTPSNIEAYDSSKIYVGGDKVIANSKVYVASWWTTNEDPTATPTPLVWKLDSGAEVLVTIPSDTISDANSSSNTLSEELINAEGNTSTISDLNESVVSDINTTTNNTPAIDSNISVDETLSNDAILQLTQEYYTCHHDQVYNHGDSCQVNEQWYTFKWWTKYQDGVVDASMQEIESQTPALSFVGAKGLETWSATKVYPTQGISVLHDNGVYTSKYWSKGNVPQKYNSETPWEFIGFADTTSDTTQTSVSVVVDENTEVNSDNPIVIATDENLTTATHDPMTDETVVTTMADEAQESIDTTTNYADLNNSFYMPFVDVGLWPPFNFDDAISHDIKNFALAFITGSSEGCHPRWGGYSVYTVDNSTLDLVTKIRSIHQAGGKAMISFGGAAASYELADVCKSTQTLQDAYEEVLDKTGVKMIDFDIEGANSLNEVAILRRVKALKAIQDQEKYNDVKISFTLAVMPWGLVDAAGLKIVKTAVNEGVKFHTINLMLMDYGPSYPAEVRGELKMAAYSIRALQSVNTQLHAVLDSQSRTDYPQDNNGEFYNLLGAIPMIGQNDTLNEVFYEDDVQALTNFCNQVGVKMTSMWSINRDKPTAEGGIGSKNSLYLDTRLPDIEKYEFSDILKSSRN